MADTTTAQNACNARVYFDNAAGVLTEITGESTKASLNLMNDIGEWKVFSSGWKHRNECGRDWKVTLEFVYSTAASEAFTLVKDWYFGARGKRTLRIDMPDSSAGSDRFEGEVLFDTGDVPLEAGNPAPVLVTLNLLPDGELTHNIIGS